jgi:hypothetical protein
MKELTAGATFLFCHWSATACRTIFWVSLYDDVMSPSVIDLGRFLVYTNKLCDMGLVAGTFSARNFFLVFLNFKEGRKGI